MTMIHSSLTNDSSAPYATMITAAASTSRLIVLAILANSSSIGVPHSDYSGVKRMLRHCLLVLLVVLDGRERVFYGKLDNWKEWISIRRAGGTPLREQCAKSCRDIYQSCSSQAFSPSRVARGHVPKPAGIAPGTPYVSWVFMSGDRDNPDRSSSASPPLRANA